MTRHVLLMLTGVGWAVPAAAVAATVPNVLIAGTMGGAVTTNNGSTWCSIDIGPSSFQRNGTGPALISFTGLNYTIPGSPTTYYALRGQARFTFESTTGGRVIFDFPPSYPQYVRQPIFSNFSQVYNSTARVLTVTFKIQYPNCTVGTTAIYRR